MTPLFTARGPTRKHGKGTPKEPFPHHYEVTATFDPAEIVSDDEWEFDRERVIGLFYRKVKSRQGFVNLTRYGPRIVKRWQLLVSWYILKPGEVAAISDRGQTVDSFLESVRDDYGSVASIYLRRRKNAAGAYEGVAFKEFFSASLAELFDSVFRKDSANAVAIFSLQMRGYK